MGGQKTTGSQTTSSAIDPGMMQMRNQAWQAALKYAQNQLPGASQQTNAAAGNAGQSANYGLLGQSALAGDPNAVQQMMSPYIQSVINPMQKQWEIANQQAMNAAGDQAQGQGAYGGDRMGIAQGTALSQNALNEQQQIAGLYNQGFGQAMNQAGQLGWQGTMANNQLAGLGDYLRQIGIQQQPGYNQYATLNSAVRGLPYGQTNTATSSTDLGSKIGGGLLSGAGLASGLGLFSGGGLPSADWLGNTVGGSEYLNNLPTSFP